MMDVSGNFHGEDFNKEDFLDFVITPGLNDENLTGNDFESKQLKSLGLFYDNFESSNDRNDSKEKQQTQQNSGKENCERDGSEKETNNNHLMMGTGAGADANISYTPTPYWNNKDEIMKWDTSMLVDEISGWNNTINQVEDTSSENTDGSIYTLTVLNSQSQSHSQSLASNSLTEQEEIEIGRGRKNISPWYRETQENSEQIETARDNKSLNQGPNDMLVIESLLNIIPNTSNSQSSDVPISDKVISSISDNKEFNKERKNILTHSSSPINLNEEQSYFIRNSSSNVNKIMLELNLDENNRGCKKRLSSSRYKRVEKSEWMDLTESNISSDLINNSLLRNALQGKSLLRYNGGSGGDKVEKASDIIEYSAKELQASINNNNNTSSTNNNNLSNHQFSMDSIDESGGGVGVGVIKVEKNQMETMSMSMPMPMPMPMPMSMSPTTSEHTHTHTHTTLLLYPDNNDNDGENHQNHQNHQVQLCDRINILEPPSENTNMDDIFLSHFDNSVAFAQDYEKLKSIENEVAESVGLNTPYYFDSSSNTNTTSNAVSVSNSSNYLHHNLLPSGSLLNPIFHHNQVPTLEIPSTTLNHNFHPPNTTNVQKSRKYKRQSLNNNDNNSGGNTVKSSNGGNGNSGNGTSGSASGSGLRKERSLHYCNICNKGFKDKYSVNVHIRTHTGEKPFSCTLCGKSFRQKAHLAKHYHTHLTGQSKATNQSSSTSNSSKNR